MDDKVFRDRIRTSLRGTFTNKAQEVGLHLDEGPNDETTIMQKANKPTVPTAPINKEGIGKTVKGLFINMGNVLKANNKIANGISVGINDIDLQKMADEVASSIVKGDANSFKTSMSRNIDALNRKILDFAKKQQATQQQNQAQPAPEGVPGQGSAQPLKAAEVPGHDIIHADSVISPDSHMVRERENPISVGAMQGILKFATPTQVGEAVKAMNTDQFAQFVSGLQKDSLDMLSSAINNEAGNNSGQQVPGGNAPKPNTGGNTGNGSNTGGGNNNAEGNLKLGDL